MDEPFYNSLPPHAEEVDRIINGYCPNHPLRELRRFAADLKRTREELAAARETAASLAGDVYALSEDRPNVG